MRSSYNSTTYRATGFYKDLKSCIISQDFCLTNFTDVNIRDRKKERKKN